MDRLVGLLCLFIALLASRGSAQRAAVRDPAPQKIVSLSPIGSEREERARVAQLLDSTANESMLLRSASSRQARRTRDGLLHFDVLVPEMRMVWNSAIPNTGNDGALWAGRGLSSSIAMGLVVEAGPVRLILAPEYIIEQNLQFQAFPYPLGASPPRSVFANPFHPPPESIDLPIRFGNGPRYRANGGQSSVTVDLGRFTVGAGTENMWWGPGISNGLVLSNNAAGFPHLVVRTRAPQRTRFGIFEGTWFVGRLDQSEYFDSDSARSVRSLAGLGITWQPLNQPGLWFGFARTVMATAKNRQLSPLAAFNVLRSVGRPNTSPANPLKPGDMDQLFSVFSRWVIPHAGLEAYVEWARFEEPASLRDLLEYPQHSQGYTVGTQWARPVHQASTFRLNVEATYLEPSAALRVRPENVSYTSAAVLQGFTERGQVLGAAIGPGSSSQSIAGDYFHPRWRLGGFLGRIRWDNGTMALPIVPHEKREDVSLLAGVRGSMTFGSLRVTAGLATTVRLNYLFQGYVVDPSSGRSEGVDVRNRTFSLALSSADRR